MISNNVFSAYNSDSNSTNFESLNGPEDEIARLRQTIADYENEARKYKESTDAIIESQENEIRNLKYELSAQIAKGSELEKELHFLEKILEKAKNKEQKYDSNARIEEKAYNSREKADPYFQDDMEVSIESLKKQNRMLVYGLIIIVSILIAWLLTKLV